MTTLEFLTYLRHLDVKLWTRGDGLGYSAPPGTLTPELRAQIIERKTEILAFLGEAETAANLDGAAIPPASRTGRLPLSFAQQRLWFLDQFQPGSPVYNIPIALRLSGRLDIAALEHSLAGIVCRHEALRTTFAVAADEPVQVIAAEANSPETQTLRLIDLQHLPSAERETEVRRLATAEARRPFDLTRGPLLRVTLLRLKAETHVLLLTMHHIISDGWSLDLFLRELAALYQAYTAGEPSPLPDLPIQYADFAVWQRTWLQGEVLKTQLAYWRQQLGGDLPVLQLPTDRPRPPLQTFNGATHVFRLPTSLVRSLKTLSEQEGVTLFMTLVAAFKVLLYRYTGQTDIVVGTPSANRNRPELEGLIGFFVNMLLLRTNLDGETTFRNLLRQVREVTLGAQAHQDLPFEQLVEAIQPERDLSRQPLFQVMFNLVLEPLDGANLPGLTVEPIQVDSGTAKFDLTLQFRQAERDLRGELEYNTDLFDAATIRRMAGHFQTLLEGIVIDPDQRPGDLPLLTTAERRQLLVSWNQTHLPYSPNDCFHQRFEDQVEAQPDSIAIRFEDHQLTYAELNRRANQLAHTLQRSGVEPGVLVGICVERSLELVVGLLGILKAGGAYVPLDPAYPAERLALMIEDARIPILLTHDQGRAGMAAPDIRVICLDSDWSTIAQESEANPDTSVTGTDLAYVIYTSGSTGRPKGVQIPHQALVNFLTTMQQAPGLTAQDSLLAVTTISFDIAALELYLPLMCGGQVVLAGREVATDGVKLLALLESSGATVMQATPATWRMLLAAGWSERRSLKILCGGEALPTELARQLSERGSSLWNLYGPTETTIWSSLYQVEPAQSAEPPREAIELIGRPIANTELYVLDSHLQPVPVGVPGELYIGGAGLAVGYLNRPELTAEKFIEHPFSDGIGARLYKTGDRVRYRPDGNLEFLGRLDHQVKLRGFRIELGEIESLLDRHPGVRAAIVTLYEAGPDDQRLVAYVVPAPGQAAQAQTLPDELRPYLQTRLPHYMLPSSVIVLETFPLTPNGKIDRRALPPPDTGWADRAEMVRPPRTPIEQTLAELWAGVLRLERAGIDDNFFELGGHSLLATQLIARIRETFQVELPLRRLFERPTIAGLAEILAGHTAGQTNHGSDPIKPIARQTPLPLHPAQERFWFLTQLEPDSPAYNISFAYRLTGPLHISALKHSLNEIIRRHEILRTTFEAVDGQPVQIIAPAFEPEVPITDLSSLPDTEREAEERRLAVIEARRPFDLARGPLLRIGLLRLNETDHLLLLTIHHIGFDGGSIEVLNRDLSEFYSAFVAGRTASLPELPIQYADVAHWQQQRQNEAPVGQLAYWQHQLGGEVPILQLPTDRPRPARPTSQGATLSFELTPALTEALKVLSRQEDVTLFMTLLAAYTILLAHHSGQMDFTIGTPAANRNRTETEGLIGLFVNTLVLRTRLDGNPTVKELLRRVRETVLDGYAHQEVPFQNLVDLLQGKRDLSRMPLFQVWFVLENEPAYRLDLPDLKVQFLDIDNETAKYELRLGLTESTGGLAGSFNYKTDLFEPTTIACLAGHFEQVLQSMIEQSESRLSDLFEKLKAVDQQQQKNREKALGRTSLRKLKQTKRKAIRTTSLKGEQLG